MSHLTIHQFYNPLCLVCLLSTVQLSPVLHQSTKGRLTAESRGLLLSKHPCVWQALLQSRRFYKSTTFYAKQSQFPKSKNERNFCFNKVLRTFSALRTPPKQTQFKPNQTQFKANQTQFQSKTNPIKANLW